MAATAVYVDICRINEGGQSGEKHRETNISATTSAFRLTGGRYGVTVHATFGGGSVTLQVQAADGTTWITALTAFTADGVAVADLLPGSYRVALA